MNDGVISLDTGNINTAGLIIMPYTKDNNAAVADMIESGTAEKNIILRLW